MTPAITLLNKRKVPHRVLAYEHDPNSPSYGLEAAEKLSLPPAQVYKTLVVETDRQQLLIALLPVEKQLSMKQIARAAGAKKAQMASPETVMRSTGYQLGGVSPLAQKKRLASYIDDSANGFQQIYVSAGKRGLDIEISVTELTALLQANFAPLAQ